MKGKRFGIYLVFLLIPLAVGGLGALVTMAGMPDYQQLNKPFFTPPALLFPLVWGVLYVLMGIGGARVWIYGAGQRALPMVLFGFQLILNFLWTFWFFGAELYLLSFLWLLLLLVVIGWMIHAFFTVDKWAGRLQIPYLLWCCFAAVLTFAIFLLN